MRTDLGLLFHRITFGGFMLILHGIPKLVDFGTKKDMFPDPLGLGSSMFSLSLAIFAEVFCSLAVILGLKTRWASVPLVLTMLVAAILVHGNDPWGKKEFALLYAFAFTVPVFTGGGKFSLDRLFK